MCTSLHPLRGLADRQPWWARFGGWMAGGAEGGGALRQRALACSGRPEGIARQNPGSKEAGKRRAGRSGVSSDSYV